MPVVRELTTRFSFDVDRRGVEKFNRTMGGMRNIIVGLAGALGVGLGVRSIVKWGMELNRAKFFVEELGGMSKSTTRLIEDLEEEYGKAFTETEGMNAFINFMKISEGFQGFEKLFDPLLEFSVLLTRSGAGRYGDFREIFEGILAASRGDFGFLEQIIGITDIDVAELRKIGETVEGAFFLKPEARPEFFDLLMQLITREMPRQTEIATRAMEEDFTKLDIAGTKIKTTWQEITGELTKAMTPILETVNELLEKYDEDLVEAAGSAARAINDFFGIFRGEASKEFPLLTKIGRLFGFIEEKTGGISQNLEDAAEEREKKRGGKKGFFGQVVGSVMSAVEQATEATPIPKPKKSRGGVPSLGFDPVRVERSEDPESRSLGEMIEGLYKKWGPGGSEYGEEIGPGYKEGGTSINININGVGDPKAVARATVDELIRNTRTQFGPIEGTPTAREIG